jgi:hypothetical protein
MMGLLLGKIVSDYAGGMGLSFTSRTAAEGIDKRGQKKLRQIKSRTKARDCGRIFDGGE